MTVACAAPMKYYFHAVTSNLSASLFEHHAPEDYDPPARSFKAMYPEDDQTQRQILQELSTIRKRLGCIGSMMAMVVCPLAVYLLFALGSCHYGSYKLNEEIEKLSLPK